MRPLVESDLGILPWPVLVRGLQFIGAFPYDIFKDDPLKFRVSLFVWSIFFNTLSLSIFFLSLKYGALPLIAPEVGDTVFIYSLCLMMMVIFTSPVIILFKSKSLAGILAHIASDEHQASTKKWYTNKSTLALLTGTPLILWLFWYFSYHKMNMKAIVEMLFFAWVVSCYILEFMIPLDLCEWVFGALSLKLVKSSDHIIPFNSTHMANNQQTCIISSLQAMERDILKVR